MGIFDAFSNFLGMGKTAPMQGPMQPGKTWQPPQSQMGGLLGSLGKGIQGMQEHQPQQTPMGDMPTFGQGAGGSGDGGLAQLIAQYMQQSRRS